MGQSKRKSAPHRRYQRSLCRDPDTITWDNTDNENIFAFYPSETIYRININDKAIYPRMLPVYLKA